ncbi:SDR family NAD(P)-dependent oxidoreductase [Pseudonocardia sp. CA-107938]|uniref:SDR family NAD(P)-dependent oxidoreductase n=1 Tax=Pseudonocardia sp. CA-107938 TaxID=3240021 RepID=UPI003D8C0F21
MNAPAPTAVAAEPLLHGRVALVTGASRGIGAAIARALARHGAAVAVNYHSNRTAADAVVADITAAGSRGLALAADAADDAQVASLVAAAAAELGDIDLLVANAFGDTTSMVSPDAPLLDQADALRARVDIQLAATLAAVRHVVPGMRRRGGGTIVLIGAALSRSTHVQGRFAEFGVTKAAQDALARHLAAELGEDGIRVNVVAPGMVPTDANAGPHQDAAITMLNRMTPLGRVSTVDDVAGTVVALSSDLTRQVTGAVVTVDGGMTMA